MAQYKGIRLVVIVENATPEPPNGPTFAARFKKGTLVLNLTEAEARKGARNGYEPSEEVAAVAHVAAQLAAMAPKDRAAELIALGYPRGAMARDPVYFVSEACDEICEREGWEPLAGEG